MKHLIHLIILMLFPLFVLGQNRYGSYNTNDKELASYCNTIDSLRFSIYKKNNLENLKYSYKEIINTDPYKNIILGYNVNNETVYFVFENDNISYLVPDSFDNFRRGFYQRNNFNVLVYLDDKKIKKHFFKSSIYKNKSKRNFTYFKGEDYITTALYYKELERFLIVEYYFEKGNLLKTRISELNSRFQWDMINYSGFYFKDSKMVFQKFEQSVVHSFTLKPKFKETELIEIATEILKSINK